MQITLQAEPFRFLSAQKSNKRGSARMVYANEQKCKQ